MRFQIDQEFTQDPRAVEEAYADPALYPTLIGLPNLGDLTVLSHERTGDVAHLRVHCRFVREFSAGVAAVIDPSKLTWVQESEHRLAEGRTTFRFLPDNYADRFSASGGTSIAPVDGGAVRTLDGELKVRAPLVGGRVEQAIVEGLQEYLAAEAALVDRYITG